jgi:DNA-binding transcriptional ArsR family regulator
VTPARSGAADVSDVFAALADPNRRAIYESLLGGTALSATILARGSAISRQAIVKHLQVLEAAGLAVSQRQGREVVYVPAATGITNLNAWLATTAGRWERRVAKLAAMTTRH